MDNSNDNMDRLRAGIEYPERRFGIIAVEKRFITVDQLWEGLVQQGDQSQPTPERMPIGKVLKDMGYLSASQISEVLEELKSELQQAESTPSERLSLRKIAEKRKRTEKSKSDI